MASGIGPGRDLGAYLRRSVDKDSVIYSRRFVQMLMARLTSSIAVNAIHYALLIAALDLTGSTFAVGLMVFTFTAPGVLSGFLAGIAVDRFSRRLILVASHVVRGLICLALFRFADSIVALYLISALFSVVNPFASPAELAAIPRLAGAKRLLSANSWFNLTTLAGNAIGLGMLAPLLLWVSGDAPVYFVAALLYAVAALLVMQMGSLGTVAASEDGAVSHRLSNIRSQYGHALDFLRRDRPAYIAIVEMTIVQVMVLIMVTLMPGYVGEVLGTSPANAVFIFAPAVIGTVVGLRAVAPLASMAGNGLVITGGFVLLVLGCLVYGFIDPIADVYRGLELAPDFGLPFDGPSAKLGIAMLFAIPLGFASTAVVVAARSALHERAPESLHGRLFAAQGVLANLAAAIPLLAGGAMADLMGVRFVLVLLAVIAVAVGLYTRLGGIAGGRAALTAQEPET